MNIKTSLQITLLTVFLYQSFALQAQNEAMHPFALFDAKGDAVELQSLVDSAKKADVIFIGEMHDDPIAHWIQKRLLDSLIGSGCHPMLGLEMLERDQQLMLNEYLSGLISEDYYLRHMRLWPNYKTDYHPVVSLAQARDVPVYATNIPRRYADGVYRSGIPYLDSLSQRAKEWVPLPFLRPDTSLQTYGSLLEMGAVHGGSENLLYAQAIKDAAMAEVIAKHLQPDACFLHLNGTFHSDYGEGIAWYLEQRKDNLDILVLSSVRQADVLELDKTHKGKGDFILCVPEDMTKTH